MSEPRRSRPPTFQPRFTLSLLYLLGFFLLYGLLFVAPEIYEALQNVPASPEQEEAAKEALRQVVRQAVRPRLPYALAAALATAVAAARAGWLPGMRPSS